MVRSNIHTHEVVGCFIFVARLLQNFGRIKKMANLQVQAAKKQEYDRIMSVLAIVQYCERSDHSLSGCNHFIEMSQPVASLAALVLVSRKSVKTAAHSGSHGHRAFYPTAKNIFCLTL